MAAGLYIIGFAEDGLADLARNGSGLALADPPGNVQKAKTHRFCQLRQASVVGETVMAPVGQLSTASRMRLAASVFAKIGLATLVSATLSSSN